MFVLVDNFWVVMVFVFVGVLFGILLCLVWVL